MRVSCAGSAMVVCYTRGTALLVLAANQSDFIDKEQHLQKPQFHHRKIKGTGPCSADHTLMITHDMQCKTPQQNQRQGYNAIGHNALSSSQALYSQ